MNTLSGQTTIVVGASRGLGHGIATALAAAGAPVVAVSRTRAAAFPELASGAGTIQPETADAAEATVPARLLDRYQPHAVILAAGATPVAPRIRMRRVTCSMMPERRPSCH